MASRAGRFCKSADSLSAACRCRKSCAEAKTGITRSHKAVIMIFLSGGPPHQDMVDLKPDAPAEVRGEFKPIRTNVPGHRHLRTSAAPRRDDGPARRHPFAGRLRGTSCGIPVHDRTDTRPAAGRRLAVARIDGVETAGTDRADRAAVRRLVAEDENIDLGRPGPARLPGTGPRSVPAQRRGPWPTWSSRASRWNNSATANGCWPVSTACAAMWMPPARWTVPIEFTEQALGILTSSRLAEALDLERETGGGARPLWPRLARTGRLRRRRPAAQRLLPGRPPAGRGRRPRA